MRAALLVLGLLAVRAVPAAEGDAPAAPGTAVAPSFSREVAPLLLERCYPCHGPVRPGGGFQVTSHGQVLTDVVPGDPEKSKLYRLITSDRPSRRMPKDKDPLTESERESIKRWIEGGARFDGVDPRAPLLSIVPPRIHPPPPEVYRAPAPVHALAFSPSGAELVAGGYRELTIWDPGSGRLLRRIPGLAESTAGLAFNKDGSLLAAASGNPGELGEVKLIDPASGSVPARLSVSSDAFLCVAIDSAGARAAAGGADRSIRVIDLAARREERVIEQHTDWVLSVAFSLDGKKIVSASRDGTAKVFNVATGELESTYTGHAQPVYDALFSSDGASIWSSGADRLVHQWTSAPSISTSMSEKPKDEKQMAVIDGFTGPVFALAMGGGYLFSGGVDLAVFEHNLSDRKQASLYRGQAARVLTLAFHEPTGRLAAGAQDGEVRIWAIKGGAALAAFSAAPGFER